MVDAENKVRVRRIQEGGEAINGMVPVSKGLTEGERVVTEGQQKVRPGIVVNPTEAAPATQGSAK